MIYLFVLIPLISIILSFLLKKKNFKWTPFIIINSILLIVSVFTIMGIDKSFYWSQVKDVEYLTSYVTSCEYYEAWNEKVSCRHPIYVTRSKQVQHTTTTGSGKSKTTRTYYTTEYYKVKVGNYHLYDVDEHGEQYVCYTNVNNSFNISREEYIRLKTLWNNEKFNELNRRFHTKDGDKYVSFYDNVIEHTLPLACEHEYENKVRVSKSIYAYQKLDTIDFKKAYDYPKLNGQFVSFTNCPYILTSDRSVVNIQYANQLLQGYNGLQGKTKQIKYWLCLFPNKPIETAFIQEAKWEGGNKNEFTTCIGYDSKTNKITWVKAFCWDNEQLKATVKNEVMGVDSLDLPEIVNIIADQGKKLFVRKPFAEFSYLDVSHLTFWEVFTISLILIVLSVISFFIFKHVE